jgi:hypothetical protein
MVNNEEDYLTDYTDVHGKLICGICGICEKKSSIDAIVIGIQKLESKLFYN